ncbi:hypothetical protein FF1_018935 [Malus domestica]
MPHPEQVHMKVEELIDTSTRAWRTNLLSELFSPEEVSLILSIPLSFRARQTEQYGCWRCLNDGVVGYLAGKECTGVKGIQRPTHGCLAAGVIIVVGVLGG